MRVDELTFPHPAALFRGDGSNSVAVIHRHAPVGSGRGWARIDESAAGLDPGYLYIEYHSGDAIVYAVGGDASDDPPQEAYRDPRLTPRGEYFEMADLEAARRAAAALSEKTRLERDAIRAATFHLTAVIDGTRWAAEVGPAAFGTTSLVLTGAGRTRVLETDADRAVLEGARQAPTQIRATESVARRFGSGRTTRSVTVALEPEAAS